jgi:hypothetical protein
MNKRLLLLLALIAIFCFVMVRQNREMFVNYGSGSARWGEGECCTSCNVNYSGYELSPPKNVYEEPLACLGAGTF